MKSKRSRLALMGVLALAISVTVGLVSGSVADAKKKSKGAKSFTISKTTPSVIPLASASQPGVAKIAIGNVGGKKLKRKIISFDSVSVTTKWSGGSGFAQELSAQLISPRGRTAGLISPIPNNFFGSDTSTAVGPTTETPDSSRNACTPSTVPPPPPCSDPDATLGPPYAGTIGNTNLQVYDGTHPQGTWFIKVFNFSTTIPANLDSVSVTSPVIPALPTS
jgi:hypothetical protein